MQILPISLPRQSACCVGRRVPILRAFRAPRIHVSRFVCSSSSVGYQSKSLSRGELNTYRSTSQELARRKKLVETQVGRNGVTERFLENLRIAFKRNEYIKVRVGSCDMEIEEIVPLLEQYSDCVCVHKIGFTVTFYRKKDLPWPEFQPYETGSDTAGNSQ
ncbi:hypothetical protein BSKO_03732 [Bryopsis sp. KO-2023]|nr:hypothetical protein BSKO_03732 [Bryopsis sp. KO-2023]